MIKSKWTIIGLTGQFFMPLIFLFLTAIFYPVFFGKRPVELFSVTGLLCFLLTVVFPLYIIAQMKISYKTVAINPELKTIAFKMFILPVTKTYDFDYFDGYVETLMKKDYYMGTYKCYYLVKDNKLKYKISGRFYSNIDELQKGFSAMTYSGSINYTTGLSIRIALGDEVLTDS